MLDKSDLLAISALIDSKLEPMHGEIAEMRSQMTEMHGEVAGMHSEIAGIKMAIENEIQPQIDGLAETQQIILEKLVPRSRVDELEDEVKFLKVIVRQMNEDLQKLKAAN